MYVCRGEGGGLWIVASMRGEVVTIKSRLGYDKVKARLRLVWSEVKARL